MIEALLDHLWQSTLFMAMAGMLTLLLRGNGAGARHTIWFVASMKFLVPFSLVSQLGSLMSRLAPPPMPPVLESFAPAMQPFSTTTPTIFINAPAGAGITPWLLIPWAVGFVAIAALWLSRSLELGAIARKGRALSIAAPVPVRSSPHQLEPALIGVVRPVVLLPEGIETQLLPQELDAIMAHELCHLHRQDNLTGALHMLVSALFWFWPPIWWLGTRLMAERETACDEAVVASGRDPKIYADGILKVCKFYLHSPLACAAGASGANLKLRVETIMQGAPAMSLNGTKKLFLAGAAVLAIVVPIAMGLAKYSAAAAQTEGPYYPNGIVAPPAWKRATPSPTVALTVGLSDPLAIAAPTAWKLAMSSPSDSGFDPGWEPALRHQLESLQKHQPSLDAMLPQFADMTKKARPQFQKLLDSWGELKSVTYGGLRVNYPIVEGVFQVEFANARTIWLIQFFRDGRLDDLRYCQLNTKITLETCEFQIP